MQLTLILLQNKAAELQAAKDNYSIYLILSIIMSFFLTFDHPSYLIFYD